jgi:hypothetical protein
VNPNFISDLLDREKHKEDTEDEDKENRPASEYLSNFKVAPHAVLNQSTNSNKKR